MLHCEPHHIPFPQPALLEHACPSAVVAAVMVGVVGMSSVVVVLVVAVLLVNIFVVQVFGFTERLARRDDGQPTQLYVTGS